MAVKFTIINLIFLCSILIKPSTTTTSSNDPWPSQPSNSDLRVISQYRKYSPFKSNSDSRARPNMIMDMATNDLERVQYLSNLRSQKQVPKVPVPSLPSFHLNNYLVQVKLGKPTQKMLMVLDTSMDEAWVPCTSDPLISPNHFAPNSSFTFFGPVDCSSPICSQVQGSVSCPGPTEDPCLFNQPYGDSHFSAILIQDSLTLANNVTIRNYAFGCISDLDASLPVQGLLGLGRGPLSLLSQTIPYFNGVFSYCLPSLNSLSFSGSLFLGSTGPLNDIPTTPLLRNSHRPSLYYVNLTGITVGNVPVAFSSECVAFDSNTGSGTIIDSGILVTRFVEPVYSAIRNEFREQVKGPFRCIGEFDTCFAKMRYTLVPLITLHFTNLDLTLPIENTLIDSGTWACLAIAAMPNDKAYNFNVIGNFQQQNLRILFDTVNSIVGIGQEFCT